MAAEACRIDRVDGRSQLKFGTAAPAPQHPARCRRLRLRSTPLHPLASLLLGLGRTSGQAQAVVVRAEGRSPELQAWKCIIRHVYNRGNFSDLQTVDDCQQIWPEARAVPADLK